MGVKEQSGELVEEEGISSGKGAMIPFLRFLFLVPPFLSERSFPCHVQLPLLQTEDYLLLGKCL